MIYLFAGDSSKVKIASYEKFLQSFPKDLEVFEFSKNNFDRDTIESFYSGSGLFFTKCIVILNSVFESEEIMDFVLEKLPLMADSENVFIVLEGKLSKSILDDFRKSRAELNVYEKTHDEKEKFNNFLLANAFGDKDKLKLWIYFRQAMDKGVGMEELIGVLFWKVKDMILKKNFTKFKEEQLKDIANKISYLLPEARKEGIDAEAMFEKFLLEVF